MEPGYNPYPGGEGAAELRMPSGFSRNIPERRIHSHNDYWRDVPVYTALSHGALSIEADVWLNPKDDKLYVSHNVASLTRARTFSRLYVDQLVDLLSRANVHDEETSFFDETDFWTMENEREERRPWTSFYEGNLTPIQLLIDLKTRGNETYRAILRELEPLRSRGWLARWNGTHIEPGPVIVLLTGNGINLDLLRSAQDRGFKTRLWSTPRWPTHVRDRVWRTLYDLGTDWLDADDIEAAAAF
ncbi:Altered inheritance of mitochondria protein 6 [Rhodotorula toruloides]